MMTNIIMQFMPVLSTSVMNLLIFLFMYKVFLCKYKNKLLYLICYLITTVLFVVINKLTAAAGIPVLNFIYGFAYIHILSFLLFEKDFKKTFMYNSLYIIALMFADILTVILLSIIERQSISETAGNPQNAVIVYSVYIFFMIMISYIFVSVLNKNEIKDIKIRQVMLITGFTFFETFVVDSYAIQVEDAPITARFIIIISGFLIINICIVHFINIITKAYRSQYEYNLIKAQNQLQLEYYLEINQKYEESRKVLHDIKKHMAIIKTIQNDDENKSQEYESLIEQKINSLFTKFHCSNNVLSAIMSQKINAAENENITVNTKVEDLLFEFIDDLDMTAIFSNLWDNSIEACKKIDSSERFINVIIGRVNDFIIICFENNFTGNVNINNGRIISSKENHEGLGISILKSTISKYSGNISFSYENNTFKAEVLIPVQ